MYRSSTTSQTFAEAVAARVHHGGHEAAVAHSGAAAAALHVLHDRMVLGVVMPGMSGMDVLRSLAEQDRLDRTAVAMFSANDEFRHESLRLGAVDYVLKGHVDDLIGLIKRHPDRRQDRAAEPKGPR